MTGIYPAGEVLGVKEGESITRVVFFETSVDDLASVGYLLGLIVKLGEEGDSSSDSMGFTFFRRHLHR